MCNEIVTKLYNARCCERKGVVSECIDTPRKIVDWVLNEQILADFKVNGVKAQWWLKLEQTTRILGSEQSEKESTIVIKGKRKK